MSESVAKVCKRSVIAAADMSTPFCTNPRALSNAATLRRRALTAAWLMSTTLELPQALHVDQVLRPPGSQLEADETLARNYT